MLPSPLAGPLALLHAAVLVACSSSTSVTTVPDPDCCLQGTIYDVPELTKAPQFPGGDATMVAWLGNRLIRPAGTDDVKEGPLIQFNVTCTGTLSDIAVKVPAHPVMDSLALAAVREMPTWVPGRIKERTVCAFHVIQVHFD